MGHHRFVKVTLSMDVADPAAENAPPTPDTEITADLIADLNKHKAKIKGKDSQIKNVTAVS